MLFAYFCCIASGELPPMGAIAAPFLMSTGPMEDGPYFDGYCGEHQYQYPGVVQLAGAINDAIIGIYFVFDLTYCAYN